MKRLLFPLVLLWPCLSLGQQCGILGDCLGFSLSIKVLDSERSCLDHCNAVEGGEWYTYDASDGFCNVLDSCHEVLIYTGGLDQHLS